MDAKLSTENHEVTQFRIATYIVVAGVLVLANLFIQNSTWQSSANTHTIMETLATSLAFMVGAMALVRYYSKRSVTFLLIGVGFIGTGLLDGYHAIVTSTFFAPFMPSASPSLIPWSWIASRLFLSMLMAFSIIAWEMGEATGNKLRFSDRLIYLGLSASTLLVFLFFAFVPLPQAYYPDLFFGRPTEFVPAIFFAIALFSYLRKGHWRHDAFEYWLVLSILIGLVGQLVFMPNSQMLFDGQFDAAHILKKVSYLAVLTGLFISMFDIFRQSEDRQRALESSEMRARIILDTIDDAVITIDDRGTVQSINSETVSMFGYAPEEVIGKNVKMLMTGSISRQHDGFLADYNETGSSEVIGIGGRALTARRKDGSEFDIDLSVGQASLNNQLTFIGVLRDITERQKAQAQMQQAQKAETIAKIAGGVAHDFNNSLQAIMGGIELASLDIDPKSPAQEPIKMALSAGIQAAELTRALLSFTQQLPVKPVTSDISQELSNLGRLIRGLMDENIAIAVDSEERDLWALVDPGQLESALLNLAINARDAMPNGGTLSLNLCRATWPTDHDETQLGVPIPSYVRIEAADDGEGIDPAIIDQVFDPFFTTKDVGSGSGLGLSMVIGFAEQAGGHATIESTLGVGTSAYIYLPVAEPPQGPGALAGSSEKTARANHGEETVLVVEDNPDVLSFVTSSLKHQGYSVMSALNMDEARGFLTSSEPLDLLFTDVVLSGKESGAQAAIMAKQHRPNIRVIYTSAYTRQIIEDNGRLPKGTHFLQKPFSVSDLGRFIRGVLDN